jgi:hypothetical protein
MSGPSPPPLARMKAFSYPAEGLRACRMAATAEHSGLRHARAWIDDVGGQAWPAAERLRRDHCPRRSMAQRIADCVLDGTLKNHGASGPRQTGRAGVSSVNRTVRQPFGG